MTWNSISKKEYRPDSEIEAAYENENSSKESITVFGNAHFPLAAYTKLYMKREYAESNLSDIADLTWFCYKPIHGKPCGLCNPCLYTIKEGMSERFDKSAILRSKVRRNKALYFVYRVIRKAEKTLR